MATSNTIKRKRVEKLSDDELLDALRVIGTDIVRRNKNYGSLEDPVSILEGVKFAHDAKEIQTAFTHSAWPYGLHHAERTLMDRMRDADYVDKVA